MRFFFIQIFPHPRRFFGFNTSCFWQRKVLYLYRDMGGASAPPFFRHFPFKNGGFRSASRKNWVRIQEKLGAHPGKTTRRVGKIGRRKVFSKVKDVNVESRKKRSKLLVFRRNSSTFLSSSLCLLSRHLLSRWVRFDLITKLSTQFLKKHPHFFHRTSKDFFKGRKKDIICFFTKKTIYICTVQPKKYVRAL